MTDAEVSYSALEAAWVYLHSSHDSVAFEHGLIPNKEAVPSHSFGGMLLRVFKGRCFQLCLLKDSYPSGNCREDERGGGGGGPVSLQTAAPLGTDLKLIL